MQEPVKPVAEAKPASAKRSARFSPKIAVKGPVLALLALVIILGSTLRFVGIGWSLPDARHPVATYHPDEAVDFKALQFVDIFAGQFDIGFYNYGTLYFYLSDFAQTIGHGYGAIPNTPSLPAGSRHLPRMEEAARNLPETRGIYLSARILTALMGVLTIPVLFALGRRLYGDIVGLWAALFYAIMPLAVVHAHFFTVDVGATLFVALALLASAKLLKKQTWREYLIAGIWTGLAAATKYSVGIVICAPIVAHLMASKPDARWSPRALPLLFGATLVAFLIGCPGPLLNWNVFWNGLPNYPNSGVAYELLQHPRQGHGLLFVNTGPGWWYHLVISLRYGLGIPMLLVVVCGVAAAIKSRSPQDRLLLVFTAIYYGITGLSGVRFARYMIPLYPALAVLAARLLVSVDATGTPVSGIEKIRLRLAHPILAVGGLLTLLYSYSLVHIMAAPDPRDRAADAIASSAPESLIPPASVAFAKAPWYFSPPLSPWFGEMAAPDRRRCIESTRYRFLLPAENTEFDTRVIAANPDYLVVSNIETTNELRLHKPGVEQFLKAIPADYRRTDYTPQGLVDMAFSGSLVPDDLLYILPHIVVYQRAR